MKKNINDSLLSKKRKKSDSSSSSSSSSSSEKSEEELKKEAIKYKALFSGKLPKLSIKDYKEEKSSQFQLSQNVKNKKDTKLNAILPPPKKHLTDQTSLKKRVDFHPTQFKSLANPDYISDKPTQKSAADTQGSNDENKSLIPEINQNDLIDKNWEQKYLAHAGKKEAINKNDEIDLISKEINIKKIVEKFKNSEDFNNLDIKSKHGKISTKQKYGW